MKHFIFTPRTTECCKHCLRFCINAAVPAQREYGQNNGGGEVENKQNTDWTSLMLLSAAV